MKTAHLFPSRTIRVSRPRPHNTTGWVEVTARGVNDYDPWSEAMWEQQGKLYGFTPVFHGTRAEAESALAKEAEDTPDPNTGAYLDDDGCCRRCGLVPDEGCTHHECPPGFLDAEDAP